MKRSLALFLALTSSMSLAQPTTPLDSGFLRLYAETRRFLAGRPVGIKLTPDGSQALFLRARAKSPEQALFALDTASGQVTELLTPEALLKGAAEKLSTEEKARLERMRITARGFTDYQLSKDGKKILVALSGKLYVVERAGGKVTPLATGEGAAIDAKFSPDGRKIAFVRKNDLFVLDLSTNRARALTTGGSDKVTHGVAEFVAQEEMSRYSGYWWGPDSNSLAYTEVDHSKVEQLTIADPMHPESGSDTFYYPRAGKDNAKVRLGLIPAGGGSTRWLKWDAAKYPYLATVNWPKKGPLSILVQNREQTESLLLAFDAASGKAKTLVEEKDEAWLNLEQAFPHWLEDGSAFFWYTERNGGPEVELRKKDGTLASSWVKPGAGFVAWVGYDDQGKTAYFTGSANPTETHVFSVKEGAEPVRVKTDETASARESAVLSTDGRFIAVTATSTLHMPKSAVFGVDGKKIGDLPSVAVEPPVKLNLEIRRVAPGGGFWATVIRPTRYQKGTKIPVIVEVYGGPGVTTVGHTMRENLLGQWLADQGYIVVKIDGRGTPRRGRKWEREIKNDFSVAPLEDQISGLQALAKEIPEMDMSRVGIYGWSFGGYMSALAVLKRPDVFKTACAGAPVVDWTDYDTHYTERYLGLPSQNGKGYEASSLLTYAPKLERPLLLIHGTADDNVYFMHSLKLSDALFKNGKAHQLLPLSNFTHMVPDPLVTERLYERIARHFKDTL